MARPDVFPPIPPDELPAMVGKQVHVRWARSGCTWNLVKVEGRTATLRTPKTKRVITADISDLLYTHKHAHKVRSTNKSDTKE